MVVLNLFKTKGSFNSALQIETFSHFYIDDPPALLKMITRHDISPVVLILPKCFNYINHFNQF